MTALFILFKKVNDMKAKPKTKQKKKENLSYKDLKELMGTKMDTFKRVKGAIRRK